MWIKYQKFLSNNFFSLVLLFAVIIVVFISYNRFIVRQDYIVGYEGDCDPVIENCFVGCEDDECTSEYYYTKMQKYEPDLYAECGTDITDCEKANVCLPNDRDCSKTYCDSKTSEEECTSNTLNEEEKQVGLSTEKSLQDNVDNSNI